MWTKPTRQTVSYVPSLKIHRGDIIIVYATLSLTLTRQGMVHRGTSCRSVSWCRVRGWRPCLGHQTGAGQHDPSSVAHLQWKTCFFIKHWLGYIKVVGPINSVPGFNSTSFFTPQITDSSHEQAVRDNWTRLSTLSSINHQRGSLLHWWGLNSGPLHHKCDALSK